MRRKSSITVSRKNSTLRRRSEKLRFDEFGFALTKRKEQKLHHRCHNYSYPKLTSVRVKELCELLSYWNGSSFICKSQIERFIRMGIPPTLRGRVWKCVLTIDTLKETSDFNYQTCLSEVRGPLVDLGVSEYGILSAITTLSETQNDLDLNNQQPNGNSELHCSLDDITLFRQIALDLQRSFPTHRSLMGESPEAIEGQAKLFRVLIAYAKYNPQVGYSQGMSYIAAVLLMQLGEEEAFWALTALLDKPKYLSELFCLSLTKVQHQLKVFEQLLKHRKPKLFQHLESVGVSSVHFVMPWFLTLFTSLPCWDSVLAVWDLIILHGLLAVFRTALTIMELLEPRLMDLNDEGAVLPLLLRVPVDVAQYTVLVPALWNTELQEWELKCMNSLVLDESLHGPKPGQGDQRSTTVSSPVIEEEGIENVSAPSEGEKTSQKGAKSVLTRVMRMAQRYLLDPIGRQQVEETSSQTDKLTNSRQRSPVAGLTSRSRSAASFTPTRAKSRRRSQQKAGVAQPAVQSSDVDVNVTSLTVKGAASGERTERSEQTFKRSGAGPDGKMPHRRSNHSLVHQVRVKSVRLLRNKKRPPNGNPPASSSVLPSSVRAATLPSSFSKRPNGPHSTRPSIMELQQDTPRAALIKELSSRHQSILPVRNVRESKLI